MEISVYKLKNKFQQLLMPLCQKLNDLGFTPNQITILTLIYSIVFSFIIYKFGHYRWILLLIPVFFLKRMALNALDGMIANKFNKKTKLGMFLNEICDVVADSIFYYCFFSITHINQVYFLIFIFLSILTEYVGVTATQVDNKRHYEGPMGKSDRAVLVSILGILIFFKVKLLYINIVFIIGMILLILTIYNRIKNSLENSID